VDEVVGGVAIAVTWIFTVGYIAAYFFMICKFYFDNFCSTLKCPELSKLSFVFLTLDRRTSIFGIFWLLYQYFGSDSDLIRGRFEALGEEETRVALCKTKTARASLNAKLAELRQLGSSIADNCF
jgi:hypothetical protein